MRRWMLGTVIAAAAAGPLASPAAADFPPADSGYHSYAEVAAETQQAVADHPSLVQRTSIGKTYEGRDIWAIKVSDNVATDEDEPEVLFDANQHAREHLTVEMALYILRELTSTYATDARIRNVVDTREIWIVPSVNPDGAEYDVASGVGYASWRKNRQPNPPSGSIGTDLNRNWGWQWGCCDGSSTTPGSEEFRGASAFSSPETAAVRDFVLSRRVGNVQQIKAAIDFHSYGELVMWPYAYTLADTAPGMTADQHNAFAALGTSMAQSNNYHPQQASDLYISDGNLRDWLWGQEGVFAYGFEMWPGPSNGGQGGFYPPDESIAVQTSRNREAVLRLLEIADCPYRAIGKEFQYCGIGTPPPPPPGPPPPPPPPPPGGGAGAGAAAPQTPAPTGDAGDATRPKTIAAIAVTRAGFDAAGRIRLRVRCTKAEVEYCRGTVKLAARLPGSTRTSTLASASYAMVFGDAEAVTLRLGAMTRRALRRRTSFTVTATIATRQETTGTTIASSRRVTLVRKKAARTSA